MHNKNNFLFIFLFILSIFSFLSHTNAQNKNYLTFSGGYFDFNKKINTSVFGSIEYRFGKKLLFLNPITGVMANTDGGFFIFAGITMDIPFTNFLILTPSFAPGYYNKGKGKDLFFTLEFRSKLELALKLINDIRIGVSISHISNASLGPPNPGAENVAVNLTFPL
jgi:lipid A 3-O-deacylase